MAENKTNGTSRVNNTATKDGSVDDAAAEALAQAEEAEAEAAEAEALAAAARARARAIRLRRQAQSAVTEAPAVPDVATPDGDGESAGRDGETATAVATDAAPPPEETPPEEAPLLAAAPLAAPPLAAPPLEAAHKEAPRSWRRLPGGRVSARVALGLTLALICALLAASGYMMWQHRTATAQRHRSAEFAAAARQGVVTLMTLDYSHAKNDVQRVIDSSTGRFKDDFQNRADDFTKVVQDSKVVTTASVNATAVQSMTDNSAVVLVAATSQVTNATGAKNQSRAWRLSVTVQRDGGQIKMSNVEFVP